MQDIIWLCQHLETLVLFLKEPTLIFEGNTTCIEIAKKPSNHKGTKQVLTKYFFVRDELNKSISLQQISSNGNTADVFTKSLASSRFLPLREKLCLREQRETMSDT